MPNGQTSLWKAPLTAFALEMVGEELTDLPRGYRELEWHLHGVKIGVRNLAQNGFRLGVKRTLGKILQPINSYPRFPEYELFRRGIVTHLAKEVPGGAFRVLDLGSPKLFGLIMAESQPLALHAADISRSNLEPYALINSSGAGRKCGITVFCQLDGRRLPYADQSFDVAYAMSVVEHIEGCGQDTVAMLEMIRVLKPGGLLSISVPIGPSFVSQKIKGRQHGVEPVEDRELHFFQRIYDPQTVEERLTGPLQNLAQVCEARTVIRRPGSLARGYHRARALLGEDVNGALGFLNPFLSMLLNQDLPGLVSDPTCRYSSEVSLGDVYADLILHCQKN